MKSLKLVCLFLLFSVCYNSGTAKAQCISFARNIAKPLLGEYIHDGNYNATYMEEGESAELYKTFFEGEEYRLVVTGVESLPALRFRLLDDQRNVIFDNANHNNSNVWDFTAKLTGTMIVYVEIPDTGADVLTGGCVALLFGVKSSGTSNRRRR